MPSTFATQSRRASFIASFRVLLPVLTAITSAPRSRILATFRDCLTVSTSPMYTTHSSPSNAAAVALATPCWPAPVSAIILRLPILFASNACPRTLFILCEPVWFKSSRFRKTRMSPRVAANFGASVMMEGRPV